MSEDHGNDEKPSCRGAPGWNWPRRSCPRSRNRSAATSIWWPRGRRIRACLVVGHGLQAARRAAFTRTTFAATAPFSDDPCRLLSWANTALIERAGVSAEFVTAACVTFLPTAQILRWAYAGHPPALWLEDGHELIAPNQGTPLGLGPNPGYVEGSQRATAGAGVLLYTDGLTEARHDGQMFGLDGVSAALGACTGPRRSRRSPSFARVSPTSPTAP
jgi:sigma-B regulation protein RsbU (phosphoserine phosphatase)